MDLTAFYDELYNLPAGKKAYMKSRRGQQYAFLKDSDYIQGDEYNILTIFLLSPEGRGVASTNDIHISDLDLEAVYEDTLPLISHRDEKEITGRQYSAEMIENGLKNYET